IIASGLSAESCWRNSSLSLILSGWTTGMPRRMADSLTGEIASSIPRPRGRSGCVTTSGTEWPTSTSFSRVGTAKRGVPQKMRIISSHRELRATGFEQALETTRLFAARSPEPEAFLPFSRFHQLLDPPLDQVALERADVRNIEFAVQMIGFVQKRACQQVFAGMLEK